ncbi:MAG TPA: rod shape-determining protein MreD [Kouleothrix sp.]|uniref:rod shape-determining protein MreD n=1 Tax=Kouleothrix sp. TaxID=2779161 RepID=UPI002C2ADDD0|nr:rod shape-determining protein MreD [Kouleothrix sp.]HRC75362.1 rod shape-determining protein MreD [Kouleothrix sp.]
MGAAQSRRIEERIARELLLALVLLAGAMAQATLLPRVFGSAPNVLLLVVICHALISGPASGARWAFYTGLGLDLFADSALGSHALAMLAAVLLAALPLAWLSRNNWLLPLLGVALGALAYHATLVLLMSLLVAPVGLGSYLPVVLLPATMLMLIPALPLFLAMRWLEGRRRGEVPIDVY